MGTTALGKRLVLKHHLKQQHTHIRVLERTPTADLQDAMSVCEAKLLGPWMVGMWGRTETSAHLEIATPSPTWFKCCFSIRMFSRPNDSQQPPSHLLFLLPVIHRNSEVIAVKWPAI